MRKTDKSNKPKEEKDGVSSAPTVRATGVNLPVETINLLKMVAARRSTKTNARISVSQVISGLVEKHRGELEKEVGDK